MVGSVQKLQSTTWFFLLLSFSVQPNCCGAEREDNPLCPSCFQTPGSVNTKMKVAFIASSPFMKNTRQWVIALLTEFKHGTNRHYDWLVLTVLISTCANSLYSNGYIII